MFRGVNNVSLDVKGRMAVPSKYRERLMERSSGQLIVTVDPEHCLLLYPLPEWVEIERKLDEMPGLNKQVRRLQRLLMGHATEVELDSHGRILLPPPLREFARLDKRVVLLGQGKKFEIWDEETWNTRRDEWLSEAAEEGDLELPAGLESLSL